jgi:hypothetical protein
MQEAIRDHGVDEYVAHALFDAHMFLTGDRPSDGRRNNTKA